MTVRVKITTAAFSCLALLSFALETPGFLPGRRVLADAHNCYPYDGRWADRIERALGAGVPLAIEQDLLWYTDPRTGRSRSILSHGKSPRGDEPALRSYFLERIRPIMDQALRDGGRGNWPLITLNLDFKSNEPEHLRAIRDLLGDYEGWLCTAERVEDARRVMPMDVKPLLVLTGEPDVQEQVFHDEVPAGRKLRVFGAVHVVSAATNYRRWWNNPWSVVEQGGQQKAGAWTRGDEARLRALVDQAHAMGLWIRFYTLDGAPAAEMQSRGWFPDYNFGSRRKVLARWRAAIEAGADFIATDQYEEIAALKASLR